MEVGEGDMAIAPIGFETDPGGLAQAQAKEDILTQEHLRVLRALVRKHRLFYNLMLRSEVCIDRFAKRLDLFCNSGLGGSARHQ